MFLIILSNLLAGMILFINNQVMTFIDATQFYKNCSMSVTVRSNNSFQC